jgi:transaldolase
MTVFVDTASYEEACKYVRQYGLAKGITSNQSIFAKEKGVNYKKRISELLSLNVPVSIELTCAGSVGELVAEAVKLENQFDSKYLVIKVPMWKDGKGIEVAKRLAGLSLSHAGHVNRISVNITCLMNAQQVILASEVGATYASLFYNRMIDFYGSRLYAQDAIRQSRIYLDNQESETKLICGSIRHPNDVQECFGYGAHIVTVTPEILAKMPFNEKTEETIKEFDVAWRNRQK